MEAFRKYEGNMKAIVCKTADLQCKYVAVVCKIAAVESQEAAVQCEKHAVLCVKLPQCVGLGMRVWVRVYGSLIVQRIVRTKFARVNL
jgi:hypothetical protein